MSGIVVRPDAGQSHAGAFIFGVNELTITDVDTDMAYSSAIGAGEEDEIADLPVTPLHPDSRVDLTGDIVSDIDTERVDEDELGESGTIETTGSVAAGHVGRSEKLHRVVGDELP